ncbi:CCHC-type domain-containing protein [Trichonephila clavipes]|nr:CCHC-type domain-containing protein [Trichonephila clavipes]
MWLYYCKLRGANDFESVNQLIVADKMFEMLDSETYVTHIGVLQGEEWKNFDKGQVTEIKKFACFTCGSDKHFKRDCPKNKGVDNKRLNVNKVSTEGKELEDGTVAARVDLLDGKLVQELVYSGTEITVIKKDLVPGIPVEGASTIYLKKFLFLMSKMAKISHKGQILLLGGACKDLLPAPGNRSNETRYREKDLATREDRRAERGEKGEAVARKNVVGKRRYGWTMYCNLVAS